jgi:hypothetical protein
MGLFAQFGFGPKECGTLDSSVGLMGMEAGAAEDELLGWAKACWPLPSMIVMAIKIDTIIWIAFLVLMAFSFWYG